MKDGSMVLLMMGSSLHWYVNAMAVDRAAESYHDLGGSLLAKFVVQR